MLTIAAAFAAGVAVALIVDRRRRERELKRRRLMRHRSFTDGDHNVCAECGATGSHTGYCSKSMMRGGGGLR